jgi:hypothetical protein
MIWKPAGSVPRKPATAKLRPPSSSEKKLGWPRRCKLAHAFLWEYSDERLNLAQFLGRLGVFLTLVRNAQTRPSCPGFQAARALLLAVTSSRQLAGPSTRQSVRAWWGHIRVSLHSAAQPLYARFPYSCSGCVPRVTIGYRPRRAARPVWVPLGDAPPAGVPRRGR